MAEYTAAVAWQRGEAAFSDSQYSRAHTWQFDGGVTVPASASPHVVPLPLSDPSGVDPEEAFVAAVASCHMLSFLAIAAKRRFVVDRYVDQAVGVMAKNEQGRLAMTRVTLRPQIAFAGPHRPTDEQIAHMHHRAHEVCYIANSIKTEVVVEPAPL